LLTILSREWIPLQLSEIHMIDTSLNIIVPILDTTVGMLCLPATRCIYYCPTVLVKWATGMYHLTELLDFNNLPKSKWIEFDKRRHDSIQTNREVLHWRLLQPDNNNHDNILDNERSRLNKWLLHRIWNYQGLTGHLLPQYHYVYDTQTTNGKERLSQTDLSKQVIQAINHFCQLDFERFGYDMITDP
jgi:hypothetical protein